MQIKQVETTDRGWFIVGQKVCGGKIISIEKGAGCFIIEVENVGRIFRYDVIAAIVTEV